MLLLAAVFIGVPAIIGLLYYRWRSRKKRSNTPIKTPRSRR